MDFNIILIVLGVVALVALIAHGLWSHRREKSQYFQNSETFSRDGKRELYHQTNNKTDDFQVVNSQQTSEPIQQELTYSDNIVAETMSTEQAIEQIRITLPTDKETSSLTPHSSVHEINLTHRSITELEQNTYSGVHVSLEVANQQEFTESVESEPSYASRVTEEVERFISLYVVAPENAEFKGTDLAQGFEDLGLLYGESGLYHYHLDMSTRGPVIFSVANINQPGTFEPYRFSDFRTVGLVFFMQIPSIGSDSANLKMMICSARNLAKQLSGFVLTDEQEIFNDLSEAAYLARLN